MKKIGSVFFILLFFIGCATNYERFIDDDFNPVGKIYYTKVNIWYDQPDKISSTNHILWRTMPLGTKVSIIKYGDYKISFFIVDDETVFSINHNIRTTPISLHKVFDRYFSEKNIRIFPSQLYNLDKDEQNTVLKCKFIDAGASKEAVLLALGYPAYHQTPDLKKDLWIYWAEYKKLHVFFRNNKVSWLEDERDLSW